MNQPQARFLEYGVRIGGCPLRGALLFSKRDVCNRFLSAALSCEEQAGVLSGWCMGEVSVAACERFLASFGEALEDVPVYLVADISHAGVNWLSAMSGQCRARGIGASLTCGINDRWIELLTELPGGKQWQREAAIP